MRICLILVSVFFWAACGQVPPEESQLDSFSQRFPRMAQPSLTPGDLCKNPDRYRFPERIPYCNRSASRSVKAEIIETYDETFGFQIGVMDRKDFKIDHYLPLCLGGSNSMRNLWPQHRSVYTKTDPVEHKLCALLQEGVILQETALQNIRYAKTNLDDIEELLDRLNRL